MFLREDDLSPVVRVFAEEERLLFGVVSTGEVFEVSVDPVPKRVTITFEAPQILFSPEKPALAKAEFTVHGGRGVLYGQSFLFMAPGAEARADRRGNFRLGREEPASVQKGDLDPDAEGYGELSSPVLALRTAVEAMNRGEWDRFTTAVSRFALTWINSASFQATHDKLIDLPMGISVREAKWRNPAWVEIRYSYSPLYARALEAWEKERKKKGKPEPAEEDREKRRAELESRFREEYGKNRYVAFLVREGENWHLDFLDME
jgi:hypothetical protein